MSATGPTGGEGEEVTVDSCIEELAKGDYDAYIRGIQLVVAGKEEREPDSYQKEQSRQLIRRAEETACAIAFGGGHNNDETLERIRGMVLRIPNTLAMLTVDWDDPFYIANCLLAVVRGYIQGKFGQYEGIRDVKKSLKNTRA
ncbi:hypothetical protein FOZ63_028803 [Perkinsus olseni]|uniref:Uncharacterized protein n=1 Tax=Perkinsus olseni TaxID=32597 RepID=A0A7J6U5A5_PEROL|nr:hypothetical protein FOZ63_028803 [Perkinsus olseni]